MRVPLVRWLPFTPYGIAGGIFLWCSGAAFTCYALASDHDARIIETWLLTIGNLANTAFIAVFCGLSWAGVSSWSALRQRLGRTDPEIDGFSVLESATPQREWSRLEEMAAWMGLAAVAAVSVVAEMGQFAEHGYSSSVQVTTYLSDRWLGRFVFGTQIVNVVLFYLFLLPLVMGFVLSAMRIAAAFRSSPVRVLPDHPDRCGGHGAISDYVMLWVAVAAATLLSLMYSGARTLAAKRPLEINWYVGMWLYSVLVPTVFFALVRPSHRALKAHKHKTLAALLLRSSSLQQRLLDGTADESYEALRRESDLLKEEIDRVRDWPTWPFRNYGHLRAAAVWALPLAGSQFVEKLADLVG